MVDVTATPDEEPQVDHLDKARRAMAPGVKTSAEFVQVYAQIAIAEDLQRIADHADAVVRVMPDVIKTVERLGDLLGDLLAKQRTTEDGDR